MQTNCLITRSVSANGRKGAKLFHNYLHTICLLPAWRLPEGGGAIVSKGSVRMRKPTPKKWPSKLRPPSAMTQIARRRDHHLGGPALR